MGERPLANRVVMAPLTRCRATNPDLAPTELHARYYSQRASAGLIVTEGTWISRDAVGWHDVPGLFTEAQVRGWSAVTDAVHREGGVIFAQLWHTGSTSHPDFFAGTAPLGPSAVNPGLRSPTPSGDKPTVTPRAMTRDDIRTLATTEYIVDRLNDYPLAHWLLMGAMADLSGGPLSDLQGDSMFSYFRPRYRGTVIANVGMTRERGNRLIADELADLVAFGQTFIANPDLPARFAALAPIERSDRALHYTPGPHGYTDYPPYQRTVEAQGRDSVT